MRTQNIKRLLKALWIKSCRYDGIDPNRTAIVFSDNNPIVKRYDRIMRIYLAGR